MDEWQTIESAPKDEVILLSPEGYRRAIIGMWDARSGCWFSYESGNIEKSVNYWQKLPELPKL